MSADFMDIAKQSEANARIRDAAPELLNMVKQLLAYHSDDITGEHGFNLHEDARALIAGVEGK